MDETKTEIIAEEHKELRTACSVKLDSKEVSVMGWSWWQNLRTALPTGVLLISRITTEKFSISWCHFALQTYWQSFVCIMRYPGTHYIFTSQPMNKTCFQLHAGILTTSVWHSRRVTVFIPPNSKSYQEIFNLEKLVEDSDSFENIYYQVAFLFGENVKTTGSWNAQVGKCCSDNDYSNAELRAPGNLDQTINQSVFSNVCYLVHRSTSGS